MITYTSIYKNGKPEYFFLKIDNDKEWNFIHPYFLFTTSEKTSCGSIREMDCLFSGSVWFGKQKHGYGYAPSSDVFDSLIGAILKNYDLSENAQEELRKLNTHDDKIKLSEELLKELSEANDKALKELLYEVMKC